MSRKATCTQCQSSDLEAGFISDDGQSASGAARWIEGPLERGLFGGARRMGRQKWEMDAYRCTNCGHLELFALRQ